MPDLEKEALRMALASENEIKQKREFTLSERVNISLRNAEDWLQGIRKLKQLLDEYPEIEEFYKLMRYL